MPKVFLSYSRRDGNLAATIARELRKYGVEALLDESVRPGDDFRRSIKSAIRKSDGFVLVVTSPDVAASSWRGYELGMAEALGKPILLLLSQNHSAAQLPSDLAGLPIAAFDPERPELMGREIVDRLLAAA
jgi:predicted nucleotide-binding protein